MKNGARVLVAGTALMSIVALAACGSSSGGGSGGASTDGAKVSSVGIELTNEGCKPDVAKVEPGSLTFNITNKNATGVTEVELLNGTRILAEKENLAPGFTGSFSLKLGAGTYEIYCPGAKTAKTTFTVTGTPAPAPTGSTDALSQGATQYAAYVVNQAAALVAGVQPLVDAITKGDLAAAKIAYAQARAPYERIEPVAESFAVGDDNLDADIDARQGDVPDAEWKGFHFIEKALFEDNTLTGLVPVADELLANVKKLQTLVADLTYQPAELANGAVELLEEVQSGKITGEEERYSHIDLLDFAGNVEGADQAFAYLQPGLNDIDKTLSDEVATEFTTVETLLDTYRDTTQPSGYKLYTSLTDADIKALAQAVQALVDPLSSVAAKVV
jgi:iron uptake system component EfeO